MRFLKTERSGSHMAKTERVGDLVARALRLKEVTERKNEAAERLAQGDETAMEAYVKASKEYEKLTEGKEPGL
jgi:hypothetical protein